MCFNTDNGIEDFGRSTSGSVPLPSTKPTVTTQTSIIDDLWNGAKGVFNYLGSIELERYELKRIQELRNQEETAKIEQQKMLAGAQAYLQDLTPQQQIVGGASIGAIVLLGAAAFMLLNK